MRGFLSPKPLLWVRQSLVKVPLSVHVYGFTLSLHNSQEMLVVRFTVADQRRIFLLGGKRKERHLCLNSSIIFLLLKSVVFENLNLIILIYI